MKKVLCVATEITAGNLPLGNSNSKEMLTSKCQYSRNCLPSGGVRPEESIWRTLNSLKENKGRNGIRGIYELSPRVQILSYIHLASTVHPKTNFRKKILLMSIQPKSKQRNMEYLPRIHDTEQKRGGNLCCVEAIIHTITQASWL